MLGFESLFRCHTKSINPRGWCFLYCLGIEDSNHSSRSERGSHLRSGDLQARLQGEASINLALGNTPIPLPYKKASTLVVGAFLYCLGIEDSNHSSRSERGSHLRSGDLQARLQGEAIIDKEVFEAVQKLKKKN